MEELLTYDELIINQRKERKDLLAKTQKMKHAVPKGDKKRKKEITTEIAQLELDLDLKHEAEVREFEDKIEIQNSSNLAEDNSEKFTDVPMSEEEDSEPPQLVGDITKPTNLQKLSRAQRRRNQKAQNAKKKQIAIAEQEIENLSGNRHLELTELKKKLNARNLSIYEIPSDGNCLYKAIEHQLSILDMKVMPMQLLRELTSEYLLDHKDDYLPFLIAPETGDIFSEEMFVIYCQDIKNTAAWGGHVEIQVLSQVCGKPIEVIQAQGPSVIVGDTEDSTKLIISYHKHAFGLGEHYNSVIPDF